MLDAQPPAQPHSGVVVEPDLCRPNHWPDVSLCALARRVVDCTASSQKHLGVHRIDRSSSAHFAWVLARWRSTLLRAATEPGTRFLAWGFAVDSISAPPGCAIET